LRDTAVNGFDAAQFGVWWRQQAIVGVVEGSVASAAKELQVSSIIIIIILAYGTQPSVLDTNRTRNPPRESIYHRDDRGSRPSILLGKDISLAQVSCACMHMQ
jgi:hypothetical protein